MTIGASVFLIAVGAILSFAVNVSSSSFDLDTIGNILMVAGVVGLVLSLYFWSSASRRRVATDGVPVADGGATVATERVVERTR